MSMNLCLTVDGKDIDLWQTPTYVTNMCLMTSKGVKRTVSGKKAERALQAYFEWCKDVSIVEAGLHISEINELLCGKDVDIEVYMM